MAAPSISQRVGAAIAALSGKVSHPRAVRRFGGAQVDRFTSQWLTNIPSIDADLERHLGPMRARSRTLFADNGACRRFSQLMQQNVIGAEGIRLQMRIKNGDGGLDRQDNELVEAAWKRQCKIGSWEVTGKLNARLSDRASLESLLRDGEYAFRIVEGFEHSPTRFAIEHVDVARLEETENRPAGNGSGAVRMSVEFDPKWYGRPVAYYLLTGALPGDSRQYRHQADRHTRISAAQFVHSYLPIYDEQTRGIPWIHAAMVSLHNHGGLQHAAVIAARVGANQLAFWRNGAGDALEDGGEVDTAGNVIREAEPGSFGEVGPDTDIVSWSPQYPHAQYEPFNRALMQAISSAVGLGYTGMANDLTGVSYSTMRGVTAEDRELYRSFQSFLAETKHDRIFRHWLRFQLTSKAMREFRDIPADRIERMMAQSWQPRGWPTFDPAKDGRANALDIAGRQRSISSIIRHRGEDPEEVFAEIAYERQRLVELEIPPDDVLGMMQALEAAQATEVADDDG